MSFIFMIFNINNFSIAQEQKQNRFSVSLGISPPIHVKGMGKFFNENWLLDNNSSDNSYKRNYLKLNNIFVFDFLIKQHLFLRMAGGITHRKIKEKSEYDIAVYNNDSGGIEENIYRENLLYTQRNWNISFGIGYIINKEKFSFYLGSEFVFHRYGKGKQNGDTYLFYKDFGLGTERLNTTAYEMAISGGNSYGICFLGGIDFKILKNIKINSEISQYFFYTYFNGTTTTNMNSYGQNILTGIYENTESHISQRDNLSQISFSNLVPKISIKYTF
mgnify:CR=1 FL=1